MIKKLANIIVFSGALILCLYSCKTPKSMVDKGVTDHPVDITQSKSDTVKHTYLPTRNYSIPRKVLKDLENYELAFEELKAMLKGTTTPDFERAVFISENPYHENVYTYSDFQKNIDFHIFLIRQLINVNDKSDSIDFNVKVNKYGRFNLDEIRHLPDEKKELYQKALSNWAIFTYLTDTTAIHPFYNIPYTYSATDPFGKKDWSNSQVINLLVSEEKKGNCFALTAFYKILANRLNANARLCTAPQHIYIQHRDTKGDYYNVELATAGHPRDGTIQTLTHTTTEAIKSGIALRSYDEKQSIGLCIINLAKSYEHKFGSKDDDFLLKCAETVLKHDNLNLNALLLKQQVLDERVVNFAKENKTNDINTLKSNQEISHTIIELENHLELLYRLGYRQMPFDMQEIIMTGVYPENFEDKNPSPFTTIDPIDPHRKHYTSLYGGLFQEVFETREFEPYGHFTFQTSTNKISVMDTTAQTGFLIDPVAFAYDFGARMYDARLGIFTSTDPLAHKFPWQSPYSAFANNPIMFIDADGREPVKPEVTSLSGLIKVLSSKDVKSLADLVSWYGGIEPPGPMNNVKAQGWLTERYVYSKSWGWIDMRHFSAAAYGTDLLLATKNDILKQGEKTEVGQEQAGYPSAWSYEDLVSNALGVYFETYLEEFDGTVLEALESFFKEIGVVENPLEAAPNKLPEVERDSPPQNTTYQPKYATHKREKGLNAKIVKFIENFTGEDISKDRRSKHLDEKGEPIKSN